jgi:hypothetical protein
MFYFLIDGNQRTDEEIDEMIESGFPGKFSVRFFI